MAEVTVGELNIKVEHNTAEIIDMKTIQKEQGIVIGVMNIGYIKSEIYIKNIQDGQVTMIAVAKQESLDNKKVQTDILLAIQSIREEKWKVWKDLHLFWKCSIIGLITTLLGTYIWGTVMAFIKNYGGN
ncbi:MAG TPA: hypothetical protein VIK78_00380 [Ruminiclostridium sp.]